MLCHAGAIWSIFGQLGGLRGQHGIIMAPLGSSLGLWGDKVAVARATATFPKATMPLKWDNVETGGPGRGKPIPSGMHALMISDLII